MKRISTVVVTAAAAAALVLSGCSSDEEPADAAGLRKNTATAQTTPDSDPGVTEAAPAPGDTDPGTAEAPAEDAPADEPGDPAALPERATDTTCAQFKSLDEPEQQQLIGRILGENPDSTFVGNPNAALGTAKLVCNAGKLADQKVAVVAGIVING